MPSIAETLNLDAAQTRALLDKIDTLPEDQLRDIYADVAILEKRDRQERCRQHYLDYVREMWPGFIEGAHIRIMANAFERIEAGKLKRVIINMPPGHSKSENASIYFPSWYLGRHPDHRIIQAGHTADMAVDFGSKVRSRVMDPAYHRIFPGVRLQADKKAAGHWRTNHGGEYFSVGVGGAVAGRRANLLIIDDPQSEQDYSDGANNRAVWDKAYNWFISGPLTRLFPDAAIVILQTRWSKLDLTGQIVQSMIQSERPDEWEIIELPAIINEGEPNERALWPEYWPLDKIKHKRSEITAKGGGVHLWNANYQQRPTSEEGAMIKREWWRIWEPATLRDLRVSFSTDPETGDVLPPRCEYIVQTWDTAHTKKKRSDFSACMTWGIFTPWPESKPDTKHIILLNSFAAKLEFPDLKRKAYLELQAWAPDSLLIEAKAAGWPLIQELREAGIPVQDYSPSRGEDKDQRLNAVAELFSSGMVWAPPRSWAEVAIEELASYPHGDHDDLVDCASLALRRFREGGLVRLASDQREEKTATRRRIADYY